MDYAAHLNFPLNVYACAIILEEGQLHSLHYGFDPGDDNILAAQKRATDFLLERLPPLPAKLLEVGVGICTTARELNERGYEYLGVTPDAIQVDLCTKVGLRVFHGFFEGLRAAEQFDILLFQESVQYINTSTLLTQAARLVKEGGRLLIADEVDTRVLEHARALLKNAGFQLVYEDDITQRTIPSLDYLIEVLRRHRDPVMRKTGVDDLRYSQLMASLHVRRQAYRDGHYQYLIAELVKLPARSPERHG